MCGRFVVASPPEILADRFRVDDVVLDEHAPHHGSLTAEPEYPAPLPFAPDYNVTPRAMVPIVRERPAREDREQARVLSLVRWGLVPSWAKDPKLGDRLINARSETIATTNSYKNAFRKRRCIIPADAFYEWTSKDKVRQEPGKPKVVRQPYLVHRRDGEPMAFAGLWEIWRNEEIEDRDAPDAWLRTCTIITTHANDLLTPIHDRMPVMLPEPVWDPWLDPSNTDIAELESFLMPAPGDELEVYPVSTRVNKPENNDASLVEPVEA